MNAVEAALRQATSDLQSLGAGFALVGGFAVSVHTDPRFTRDVDLAVAVDSDEMAEALVRQLLIRRYSIVSQIEQYGTGRLGTVRLAVPGPGDVLLDLLFASSGVEPEIVAGANQLTILPELDLPVASVGHLVVLKLLARDDESRPQDAPDLRALRSVVRPADAEVARTAARLIVDRGFDRGRDLVALTDTYLGSASLP